MIRSIAKFFVDTFGNEETLKTKNAILKDTYLDIFVDNPQGELLLMDLMEFAGFARTNYSNDFKPETLAFLEGQRSVVHYIMQMCEISELDVLRKDKKKDKK